MTDLDEWKARFDDFAAGRADVGDEDIEQLRACIRDGWTLLSARTQEAVAALFGRLTRAEANYRFMVERAADQRLDGYRELGQRAAAAETERDMARSQLGREREDETVPEMVERLVRERDEARQLAGTWRSKGWGVPAELAVAKGHGFPWENIAEGRPE